MIYLQLKDNLLPDYCGASWIYLLFAYSNDYWKQLTYPGSHHLLLNLIFGLTKSEQDLIVENALLRQQVIVLKRQTKRVNITPTDRRIFIFLASLAAKWYEALLIVKLKH